MDEVAADVRQSAAAAIDLVADVAGVNIEVAEESEDGAKFANAVLVDEFAQAEPLRVAVDHEGFADFYSGTGADREERFGFRDIEAEWLFAEDVLAGFSGLDRPGNVKLVGQGIVDGVDIWVGEEFFVGSVGGWNAKAGGSFPGLAEITGCDGVDA